MSGLTISAPELRQPVRLLAALALLCLLAGCGARQVVVEGNFPEPLMSPLPLNMGIWYNEEFATHEFFDEAKGRADSTWIVKTGSAQMQMWDTVLAGVFSNLEHMKNAPGSAEMNQVVDAVLIPKVEELQYAIPAHTNVKVYEIWMRYRFDMVTTQGEEIASWTMTSYGKTPTAFMQSDEAAVNLAAVVALRDAGANFATNFTRIPAVREWLELRESNIARAEAATVPDSASDSSPPE
ncbi:MAG: hypothetical protein ABJK20_10980, partial [Halieaceae bacterium]